MSTVPDKHNNGTEIGTALEDCQLSCAMIWSKCSLAHYPADELIFGPNLNRIEHHFNGESAVHRKTFWMPVVIRAWPVPGANHQKHISPNYTPVLNSRKTSIPFCWWTLLLYEKIQEMRWRHSRAHFPNSHARTQARRHAPHIHLWTHVHLTYAHFNIPAESAQKTTSSASRQPSPTSRSNFKESSRIKTILLSISSPLARRAKHCVDQCHWTIARHLKN